ncbi:MAG: AAA family ATPase, partial [Pseudonocardiaceae bacterium]
MSKADGGAPAPASGPPAHPGRLATPARDAQLIERTVFEIQRVIVGQDRLVERMLVGLLARGHLLLEGVPGVAKTLAVETIARVVGGSFSRIQFTPDLVPADILGTRIYRQGREQFDVELGPVVANFVLADEINRAPAKVQSALLEVMAERHVSIGGTTYPMPTPFLVLATQ